MTNHDGSLTRVTAYLAARQANPTRTDPWEHHEGHERALTIDDLAVVVALATDTQAAINAALEAAADDIDEGFAIWDELGVTQQPHPIHSAPWLVQRAYQTAARIVRARINP